MNSKRKIKYPIESQCLGLFFLKLENPDSSLLDNFVKILFPFPELTLWNEEDRQKRILTDKGQNK